MPIQKNNTEKEETIFTKGLKSNKSLSKEASKKNTAGRKTISGTNDLKADQRNTFLLNSEQQDKLEKRMEELGIRNRTDYIFRLLRKDIIDL